MIFIKKNFIIFTGLLLLILFGTVNPVSAIEKSNNQSKYSDEYLQLNYQKTILAGKIDSLAKDNGKYLPYFGGIYISNDSQNVILQIVKKMNHNQQQLNMKNIKI